MHQENRGNAPMLAGLIIESDPRTVFVDSHSVGELSFVRIPTILAIRSCMAASGANGM